MIRDDQGSRVFGLQIEGLTTRFYFRKSPFVVDSIGEPPNQIQYTPLIA